MFASAYPLAATICLFYTLIKMKSDGFKLCDVYQRPEPIRASGIGSWAHIITVQVGAIADLCRAQPLLPQLQHIANT